MLSREQQKQFNLDFWGEFKEYMKKHRSSNGRRINWLNYPSDVKDVYIRLYADSKIASLSLDIQSRDEGIRAIIWEQMTELRAIMEKIMNVHGEWIYDLNLPDGRTISRITWSKKGLNYLKTEDKERIFEFLKFNLLGFDKFYQEFKEILINLTD